MRISRQISNSNLKYIPAYIHMYIRFTEGEKIVSRSSLSYKYISALREFVFVNIKDFDISLIRNEEIFTIFIFLAQLGHTFWLLPFTIYLLRCIQHLGEVIIGKLRDRMIAIRVSISNQKCLCNSIDPQEHWTESDNYLHIYSAIGVNHHFDYVLMCSQLESFMLSFRCHWKDCSLSWNTYSNTFF